MQKEERKAIVDGWQNLNTGLGLRERDKKQNTAHGGVRTISEAEQTSIFRADGFGKKIISLIPEHMLRQWFTVSGDTEKNVDAYFKPLKLKKELLKLLKWDRAFGGAVMIMGVDDGGELTDPLNEGRIREISFLRVYDRYSVDKSQYVDKAPESIRFGKTEFYAISPYSGTPYLVHYSRIIELTGDDVPDRTVSELNGWGDSVLQSAYEAIRDLGSAMSGTASIIEDFVTGILNIEGLADMIADGEESNVLKRLDLMDQSRHIINTIILDKEEKYEKKTTSVAGLPELLDRFISVLAGVSGIPVRMLLGVQSGGLNNEGDGETRDFYDKIASKQTDILSPILERLIEIARLGNKRKLVVDEDFSIIYNPLWQPTEKEIAETKYINAKTDVLYIDRTVLTPPEVTISRFGGEKYSSEIIIDPNEHKGHGSDDEDTDNDE